MVENVQTAQHFIQVEQWLTHTHKDKVADQRAIQPVVASAF